jgi:hypothetical protein
MVCQGFYSASGSLAQNKCLHHGIGLVKASADQAQMSVPGRHCRKSPLWLTNEILRRQPLLIRDLMDMSTLVPHGGCLEWKPELIWLNAISCALIACAFFATAFVLGFFARRAAAI